MMGWHDDVEKDEDIDETEEEAEDCICWMTKSRRENDDDADDVDAGWWSREKAGGMIRIFDAISGHHDVTASNWLFDDIKNSQM